jgi:DNA-directed RNA polymerase subunit RPC12/RpoP
MGTLALHGQPMKRKWILVLLLWSLLWATALHAQEDGDSLSLRLTRNFGTGIGTRIQGTFTLQVSGPEDLVRVVFFLDDRIVGEDETAPFRWQFRTQSYQPGEHHLGARGYTAGGRELRANELTRQFLSEGESSRLTTVLVIALVLLVVGGRLLTNWIANRGQDIDKRPAISGLLGGTICPNCGRPYALHIWGFNLMAGRLDRCPHCGKWRLVRRATPEALRSAAQTLEKNGQESPPQRPKANADWRQHLDDSRFDDSP